MLWRQVLQSIQDRIGELMTDKNFFNEEAARRHIAFRQQEVARKVRCIERYTEISLAATIAGDAASQLSDIAFNKVTQLNTDGGRLYWDLTLATGTYTFSLYKDIDKSSDKLVAQGTRTSATGAISFTAQNSSGLSGSVNITYTTNDTDDANIITMNQYYDLPTDFIELIKVQYNDERILVGRDREPRIVPYSSGSPDEFFLVEPKKIGFWPIPTNTGTVKVWYVANASQYAFELRTTEGSDILTSVTVNSTDTEFEMVVDFVDTTDADLSLSWEYAAFPTMGDLVDSINTFAATSYVTATISTSIRNDAVSRTLENVVDLDVPVDKAYYPVYLDLEIPDEMHEMLIHGVIEIFREKDREYQHAGIHNSQYNVLMKEFIREYNARRAPIEHATIKNAYYYTGVSAYGPIISNISKGS